MILAAVALLALGGTTGVTPWLLSIGSFVGGLLISLLSGDGIDLRASVIHERLVAEHGFTGHYPDDLALAGSARERLEAERKAIEAEFKAG